MSTNAMSANGMGVRESVSDTIPRPTDIVTQSEAARQVGRSGTWVAAHVATGEITEWGREYRSGQGGVPARLVSLEQVVVVSAQWPARKKMKPRQAKADALRATPKVKAKAKVRAKATTAPRGVTGFARDEVRHFAQGVMDKLLNASSITITERREGNFALYDVSVTPRAPATSNFTV